MLGLMSFTTLSLKVLGSSVPALAADLEPVKPNNNRQNKERMIKQIEMVSKRKWLLSAATLVGVLSVTGAANAASFSPPSVTVPATNTDFTDPITLQKFDSSLGQLTSADISLTGTVAGSAGYENTSTTSTARRITLDLSAVIDLNEPTTNAGLGEVVPLASQIVTNVPRYDGRTDYAGTSGATLTSLTNTQSITTPITDPNTLALFTGSRGSNINLLFSATGNSGATGSGNVSSLFSTTAGGTAQVTYNYSPAATAVPEPNNILGIGLAGGIVLLMTMKTGQKQQA